MCAVKNQYHQVTGNWNIQNLKLELEVFLNFFSCVSLTINIQSHQKYHIRADYMEGGGGGGGGGG